MTRRPPAALAAAGLLAAVLSACATLPRYEAASDVRALLVAVRDGDQAAFDQRVDRPALKAQLRSRLLAEASERGGGAGALGVLLLRPLVDAGVDALVQPDALRAVALRFGYAPDRPIPGPFVLADLVRPLDDERACVSTKPGGACVLIFRREGGAYRLVGFEGRLEMRDGRLRLEG